MGSVPINERKLLIGTFLIEYISVLLFLLFCSIFDASLILFILSLMPGLSFYYINHEKYRNEFARHTYEKETKLKVTNL